MGCEFEQLPGLEVVVDRVVYSPELDAPPDRPHPFVYFLTIRNGSDQPVTVRGRKWVVTDRLGHKTVIEGEGVVGRTPRLDPGESFSYNSCHVVACSSSAEGGFLAVLDNGKPVCIPIPRFELAVPEPA